MYDKEIVILQMNEVHAKKGQLHEETECTSQANK